VDVVVFTAWVEAVVGSLVCLVFAMMVGGRGIVPAYTWHGLPGSTGRVCVVETLQRRRYDIESRNVGSFDTTGKESLKTDADAKEGFAGFDVFLDCR
jgi:hypothetical protein